LALVGCGARLEVALAMPGVPVPTVIALAGPVPRSELVMAAVDLALRAAGIERRDLAAVLATRGPGSFTGVRVTLATALGLARALGIPGHGVSSLMVQAARTDAPACLAAQPSRRGWAYTQAYRRDGSGVSADGEVELVELASLSTARLPVVAGAGLELPAATPRAVAVRTAAEALLNIAGGEPERRLETLVPLYVEPAPARPPRSA
jgi:tRNA threonylcarbamoyl adenosine modification protein YeaZ